MADSTPSVSAELIGRLRRLTGLPFVSCRDCLAEMPPEDRVRYVEWLESAPRVDGLFRDPIESDPNVAPLLAEAFAEAGAQLMIEQRDWLGELEQTSPAAASVFTGGTGSCHRLWLFVKKMMRERHGIEWRTPQEMNPQVFFD